MTQANTADAAARLRAAVEAGFKSADTIFWEVARSSLKGTSHLSNPTDSAREAFRELVTAYEAELARYRDFVVRVATVQLGSNDEMAFSMVDCIEDALALLSARGGGESEVT